MDWEPNPHRKLTCPLNRDHVERKFHLNQPPMFRVCVSFQRGIIEHHLLAVMSYFTYMLQLDQDCKRKFTGEREQGNARGKKTTATSRAKACGFTVLAWLYSRSLKICHPTESNIKMISIHHLLIQSMGVYSWCLALVLFFVCWPVSKISLGFRGFQFFWYGD